MAGFGPSKTSIRQTAYNAGATIIAAMLTAGVAKPGGTAEVLELLGELVGPMVDELERAVEADQKAEAERKPAQRTYSAPAGGAKAPYVSKDPGGERITKSGKHSEKTLRDIHAQDPEYLQRISEGKFGSENMKRKVDAFLATLAKQPAGSEAPASPDYL